LCRLDEDEARFFGRFTCPRVEERMQLIMGNPKPPFWLQSFVIPEGLKKRGRVCHEKNHSYMGSMILIFRIPICLTRRR